MLHQTLTTNPRLRAWLRRQLPFLATIVLVLALDQISKALVRFYLLPGESFPDTGWFRLTHVLNSGASFGLFQGKNVALAITGLIGVLAIILYYRYMSVQSIWLRIALGLQLGGAIGNLTDRARLGYVTDFFDVGAWPVFNVADSSLVTGILLAIAFTFWGEWKRPNTGASQPPDASSP